MLILGILIGTTFPFLVAGDGATTEPSWAPTGRLSQFQGFRTPRPRTEYDESNMMFASVWAGWSAWSFCSNGVVIRVRACNTVRGFSCLGPNQETRPCDIDLPPSRPIAPSTDYDIVDPWESDRKEAMRQLYPDDTVSETRVVQSSQDQGQGRPPGTNIAKIDGAPGFRAHAAPTHVVKREAAVDPTNKSIPSSKESKEQEVEGPKAIHGTVAGKNGSRDGRSQFEWAEHPEYDWDTLNEMYVGEKKPKKEEKYQLRDRFYDENTKENKDAEIVHSDTAIMKGNESSEVKVAKEETTTRITIGRTTIESFQNYGDITQTTLIPRTPNTNTGGNTVPQQGPERNTVPQQGPSVITVPQQGAAAITVPQLGPERNTVPQQQSFNQQQFRNQQPYQQQQQQNYNHNQNGNNYGQQASQQNIPQRQQGYGNQQQGYSNQQQGYGNGNGAYNQQQSYNNNNNNYNQGQGNGYQNQGYQRVPDVNQLAQQGYQAANSASQVANANVGATVAPYIPQNGFYNLPQVPQLPQLPSTNYGSSSGPAQNLFGLSPNSFSQQSSLLHPQLFGYTVTGGLQPGNAPQLNFAPMLAPSNFDYSNLLSAFGKK